MPCCQSFFLFCQHRLISKATGVALSERTTFFFSIVQDTESLAQIFYVGIVFDIVGRCLTNALCLYLPSLLSLCSREVVGHMMLCTACTK